VNDEQCNEISGDVIDGGCLWILGNDSNNDNDAKPYCENKVYVFVYISKKIK
jgi:hypothetical protein